MDKTQWLQGLLRDHEGRLLRYARRFLPDALAREAVQEAFLRLWKEGPEKLAGREPEWLFAVCRHLAMDSLRKEAKSMGTDALDPNGPIAAAASDASPADERLESAERDGQVARLIRSLPEKQQEVVRLKFQEGFSYKEISSITGHSVSHVGVLIHEAVARLREGLAEGSASLAQGGRR